MKPASTLQYLEFDTSHIALLYPIECACHQHPWSEAVFQSCIGNRYFNQMLLSGEQPIGFYIGEYIAGEATLLDVCIAPEYQGNGFGRVLVEHFVKTSFEKGAESLWLEVRVSNQAAQQLYHQVGFYEVGRRPNYYPAGIEREDAVIMSLQKSRSV
ncbi:ribosomal protein S18-alanine N-acetyltransferase [Algicola sagamiensis]|uniref:ribosomal protein S18-alanine N-acetyltransferase n=1 Tax=Algicola sagamiensis TaxID=163869 RepID=UPI000373265B|nr:ribosomal protein S18-alanine N-acetyltransferase [Algicola sagamiensis]